VARDPTGFDEVEPSHRVSYILVVDDDVTVANVVAAALPSHSVTVAYSGAEALARASAMEQCDLLITDYLMPTMAGDELVGRIREVHPRAKTILLTGYGHIVQVDRQAVDIRLAKPFVARELQQTVTDLLGSASAG
jgi:CheY-like chemotaxis protein